MVTSLLLWLAASAVPLSPAAQSLVGVYDGHQMEMAVGIELKADGRFEYGTHTVFIGRIREVLMTGDVDPLVYLDGAFRSFAS